MAKVVLTMSHLTLNSVDISTYCKKIELTLESNSKDTTTFGSAGWNEFLGGLKSGELAIELFNDYAADDLDADMFAIFGSVVTFAVRPTQSAVSTTNPSYSGSVHVKEWKPLQADVGEVAMASISCPTSGAVARATS